LFNWYLDSFKSFTSVHEVPSHDSVSALVTGLGLVPPATIAFVYSPPKIPYSLLAVFKSDTSVQLLPFQLSVTPEFAPGISPPAAKPAVTIPVPPSPDLAVFKSYTSVQLLPFQLSVIFV